MYNDEDLEILEYITEFGGHLVLTGIRALVFMYIRCLL